MNEKPKTEAVTFQEGGLWFPFLEGERSTPVHSIKFADGSIWDSRNGWRKTENKND